MMNYNFYWQPACFPLLSEFQTSYQMEQQSESLSQRAEKDSYEALQRKCQQLELENISLKEQLRQKDLPKPEKTKRVVKRRKEEDLDKKFICHAENCKKSYASNLALSLHIKTKHPSIDPKLTKKEKNCHSEDNQRKEPSERENIF